jgi:hypothetical protein
VERSLYLKISNHHARLTVGVATAILKVRDRRQELREQQAPSFGRELYLQVGMFSYAQYQ